MCMYMYMYVFGSTMGVCPKSLCEDTIKSIRWIVGLWFYYSLNWIWLWFMVPFVFPCLSSFLTNLSAPWWSTTTCGRGPTPSTLWWTSKCLRTAREWGNSNKSLPSATCIHRAIPESRCVYMLVCLVLLFGRPENAICFHLRQSVLNSETTSESVQVSREVLQFWTTTQQLWLMEFQPHACLLSSINSFTCALCKTFCFNFVHQ